MKTCTGCDEDRPLEAFSRKSSAADGRQSRCKACVRAYQRQWYEENREAHIANVRENEGARQERHRVFLFEYLDDDDCCCVDCGEADPVVLDFDHVRGEKVDAVTNLVRRGFGLDAIREEIAKCEVRCVNCHQKRTYEQCGWQQYGDTS